MIMWLQTLESAYFEPTPASQSTARSNRRPAPRRPGIPPNRTRSGAGFPGRALAASGRQIGTTCGNRARRRPCPSVADSGRSWDRFVPAHLVFPADRRVKPGVERAESWKVTRPRDQTHQNQQPELSRKHDEDLPGSLRPRSARARAARADQLAVALTTSEAVADVACGALMTAQTRRLPRKLAQTAGAVARRQTTPSQKAAPSKPITLTEPSTSWVTLSAQHRQQDAQCEQAARGRAARPRGNGCRTGPGPRGHRNCA